MHRTGFGFRTALLAAVLALLAVAGGAQPANSKVALHGSAPGAEKVSVRLHELRGQMAAPGATLPSVPAAGGLVRSAQDDAVLVEIVFTRLDDVVLKKVALPGVTIRDSFPAYRRATAFVSDLAALEAVAAVPEVAMVFPAEKPRTNARGASDSRADRAMNSTPVVDSGITGLGQKVGVLSDSFARTTGTRDAGTAPAPGLAGTLVNSLPQRTRDLPPRVQIVRDDIPGSDEGAAMAELVHDVAPGAAIAFHTAFGGEAGFAQGIRRLRDEGCTVIVDDVIYFREPMYQDGIIAREAAAAVSAGIPYFSAAGNMGDHGIRATYRDVSAANSPVAIPPKGDDLHDWGGGNGYLPVFMPAGSSIQLVMQWNQPFASMNPANGSQVDLDVYVLAAPDASGFAAPLAESREAQGTTRLPLGDPYESLSYVAPSDRTVFLAVNHHVGRKTTIPQNTRVPLEFRIVFFSADAVEYMQPAANTDFGQSTMYGHSLAAGVVSVAAVPWWESPNFAKGGGPTSEIDPEFFTSRGGTHTIMFDATGRYLRTPRRAVGPTLSAVDGCNTTFFGATDAAALAFYGMPAQFGEPDGFPNFFGTSAAAPNAAAVAALMKQKRPRLRTTEITNHLKVTARDVTGERCKAGVDDVSGSGLINAQAALARVLPGGSNLTVAQALVSYMPGTDTDDTPLVRGEAAFADVVVKNIGDRTAAGRAPFNVEISLNGVPVRSETLASLAPNATFAVTDLPLGVLPVGVHTLRVAVDPTNRVLEANETDNVLEYVFEVLAPRSNLTVTKALVSYRPGTDTDDTPLVRGEAAFADVVVKNIGDRIAAGRAPFNVEISLNGVLVRSETLASLGPNATFAVTDLPLGVLPVGVHTLRVAVDPTNTVIETNETDNVLEYVFEVLAPRSNLIVTKVLVSAVPGTDTDDTPLVRGEAAFADVVVRNIGDRTAAGRSPFNVDIHLNGELLRSDSLASLAADATFAVTDLPLGVLPVGVHTLRVAVDPTDTVIETNETDNVLEYRFEVIPPPPANDNFANALALTGCPLVPVSGTNISATAEPGEPDLLPDPSTANSIWFKFVAPATQSVAVSVVTDFQAAAGLYRGTDIASLSLASSTGSSTGLFRSTIGVTAGETIQVYVTGVAGATGNVTVSVATPANDLFDLSQTLLGASGEVSFDNSCASAEEGEPNHAGSSNGKSVWYNLVNLGDDAVTLEVLEGTFSPVIAVYAVSGTPTLATLGTPVATAVGTGAMATFIPVPGQNYAVVVDAQGSGGSGKLVRTPAPPNDRLVGAQAISRCVGETSGVNVYAWKEPGEPVHLGVGAGKSIWYKWDAPSTGVVTFDTVGSTFDTVLAIYANMTPGSLGTETSDYSALSLFATNDNVEGPGATPLTSSRATFYAFEGWTYYIVVDGKAAVSPNSGEVRLTWGTTLPPLNDFRAAATEVGLALGTSGDSETLLLESNLGATRETGEPLHSNLYGRKSVWYVYDVPANGVAHTLIVEAKNDDESAETSCGNLTFDILMGVYRDDGTPYAFTDEDLTPDARFRLVVFPGNRYFIAVDGKRSDATGGPIPYPMTIPGRPTVNWDAGSFDLTVTRQGTTPP